MFDFRSTFFLPFYNYALQCPAPNFKIFHSPKRLILGSIPFPGTRAIILCHMAFNIYAFDFEKHSLIRNNPFLGKVANSMAFPTKATKIV